MSNPIKVLTLVGSPGGKRSNTLAFSNDFLDKVQAAGLSMERRDVVLGDLEIRPCKGCWSCTKGGKCPLDGDDLISIKEMILDCDMLILASPVYANQVSAQMKALFDRLFTWCHVFPLIGRYGLSVTTTGNDGYREVGGFLEKMLATYGVRSFGTIYGTGGFTSGFFPRRESEGDKYRSLARKVASTVGDGKNPPASSWLRKMFKVMKHKLSRVQLMHYIANGTVDRIPNPSEFKVRMIRKIIRKRGIPEELTKKLADFMTFELQWWADRNWLSARSFRQLEHEQVPSDFNAKSRLIG